ESRRISPTRRMNSHDCRKHTRLESRKFTMIPRRLRSNAAICVRLRSCVVISWILCCTSGPLFGADQPPAAVPPSGMVETFRRFANVLDALQQHYIDPAQVQLDQRST